ncbi:lateral signaling target protein 2 homolog isoform X2 [Protopterus annectens]|uniref:lateral signaling target protein 2 homolog isoform X2 n=1 Tax=Protopterus annectens TaxID=7888 RepID=UPI001CF9DD83|nr:lateral signaling target protein 2 homolog isoform X2 [Protopterus annectens]
MLQSLMRKLLYKPKKSDPRPLAQFYYIDEELVRVTAELTCADIRKDPQQYLVLLSQLRTSQDRMLRIIEQITEDCIPSERESRDYLVKFPDEILQENIGVQLLFAAECMSESSFIDVHDPEAEALQPQAKQLLRSLQTVRKLLRAQSLTDPGEYNTQIRYALIQFDKAFTDFELRALNLSYLSQEMIDGYEPQLMFAIPRLAMICGLLIFPDGPLNLQQSPEEMSKLFSPFFSVLQKIRDLLYVLTEDELYILEKNLCSAEFEDNFSLQAGSQSTTVSANVTTAFSSPNGKVQTTSCTTVHNKEFQPQQNNCTSEQLACTNDVNKTSRTSPHTALSTSMKEHTFVINEGASLTEGSITSTSGNEANKKNQKFDMDKSTYFRNTEDHNCTDLEIIKRAVQIARRVARQEIRSRYRSSSDMIHRLFVCISGVADQLQTNFASDMRSILKTVFETISSKPDCQENEEVEEEEEEECEQDEYMSESGIRLEDCALCQELYAQASQAGNYNRRQHEGLPEWIPDSASSHCMSCKAAFTLLRRRHHCRNCGKIFCSQCSRHMTHLPQYGLMKLVRVCTHCYTFMSYLTLKMPPDFDMLQGALFPSLQTYTTKKHKRKS